MLFLHISKLKSLIIFFAFLTSISIASDIKNLDYNTLTGLEIPFEKIKAIALDEAQDMWGKVAMDQLIPICDLDGNIIAYDVTVKLNSDRFPAEQEIYDELDYYRNLCEMKGLSPEEQTMAHEKSWGNLEYRSFMLGARFDVTPVNDIHVGLPQYYTNLTEAKAKASGILKSKVVQLDQIIYNFYLEKWFKISSENGMVYINCYSLKAYYSLDKFYSKQEVPDNLKELEEIWNYRYKQVDTLSTKLSTKGTTTVSISGVPFYRNYAPWIGGLEDACSPVSSAMVLGYWDNNGYPNIIDGSHGWGNEPVDLINDLADAMYTNVFGSGTIPYFIDEGIEEVTDDLGYNFSSQESNTGIYTPIGTTNSHWHYIESKIDAGRPLVWSVGGYDAPEPGYGEVDHSVAVVGYKKQTESKWYWLHTKWWCYAEVHNTWDNQASYWLILKRDPYHGFFYSSDFYTDLCIRATPPEQLPPPPEPLTVVLGGPDELDSNESGTYYASTYGGCENITDYLWWERNDGGGVPIKGIKAPPQGQWIQLVGWTDMNQITISRNYSFSLKCEVIDSLGSTAYDIISVSVGPILPQKGVSVQNSSEDLPSDFNLIGNYPNPFNPSTIIEFSIPSSQFINLSVYSVSGKLIKTLVNGVINSGINKIHWNGTDINGKSVSSGIYIYRLHSSNKIMSKKMMLLK